MKRVRFVGQAREEYLAQTTRYVVEQKELGNRFVAAVEAAAARGKTGSWYSPLLTLLESQGTGWGACRKLSSTLK